MASSKKLTRAEMETRIMEMKTRLEKMKREVELKKRTTLPVLYLMPFGNDEYVVGGAKSLAAVPGLQLDSDSDAVPIYYKLLHPRADFMSLAADLERCLARFKAPGSVGAGDSYIIPFEEGKMWVDIVAGRYFLEGIDDPLQRKEFMSRLVTVFTAVERVSFGFPETDESEDTADSIGATPEKKKLAKKAEEAKKIARFVSERCAVDPNAPPVKKDEVLGMYRIWAKGTTLISNSLMVDHMRDKLGVKTTHIGEPKDGIIAFKGITLKMDDWEYVPTDGDSKVKRFLMEQCEFGPTQKIFSRTLFAEYGKWHEENGWPAMPVSEIQRLMRKELKQCPIVCSATNITIGSEPASGWHGIGLLDAEPVAEVKPVRNVTFRYGKTVERRMPGEDGEVLNTWPSVSQAAKALGIAPYKVQTTIRSAKPDEDGAILAFAKEKEKVNGDGASTSNA